MNRTAVRVNFLGLSFTIVHVRQVAKYVTKLRLLEHGLLHAANGVDEIQRRVEVKSAKDKSAKPDAKEADETDEDFIKRLVLFAAVHLHRASSSRRDDYKDNLVYQARKDIIAEFLRGSILKTCQNGDCNG